MTDNVLLHVGPNIFNCCVIGFQGTRAVGNGGGSTNSQANAKVQTFAWASWVLETGDPVVAIGFAMGTNTFEQGTNPNGSQSADGYYHPEDEVFLPGYMRLAPNNISEATQSASTNVGRYSFMGDLNPFPGFREPATSCQ